MFAWDAVRIGMMPGAAAHQIGDRFKTRNVLRWMQRLYAKHQPHLAARSLKEVAESDLPFYTRAAALDDYIQSPQGIGSAELLSEILDTIQTKPDLRAYFFRSRPHPLWAHILWDAGFFDRPPQPERVDEEHVIIPRWDVQDFLLSVAPSVPDVVLKHVDRVSPEKDYLLGALRALCLIPGELAETRVDVIAGWLDEEDDLLALASETVELIKKLVHEQRYESALRLCAKLTVPIPSRNVHRVKLGSLDSYWTMNSEARSKVGDWEHREGLSELSALFWGVVPLQFAELLEAQLCLALRLEAEAKQRPEAEFESSWRQAIEDSGQDLASSYKDQLLNSLRDTLAAWAKREPAALCPLLQQYLAEKREILRRLALHILSRFPREYYDYLSAEIARSENLNDPSIHHDFFQLLRHGYSTLTAADRKEVLTAILLGPPLEELRDRLQDQGEERESVDAYLQGYRQRWVRDRLWMIKEDLDPDAAASLGKLVEQQGKPDHPDFLSWSSFGSGGFGEGTKHIEEGEITSKSPDTLVVFLKEWTPDQARPGGERTSFREMADAVAAAMSRHLQLYCDRLIEIALIRPEFADALVNRFLRGDDIQPEQWITGLDLSEGLLNDETVRADVSRTGEVCWVDVRRSIARALSTQLERARGDSENFDRYLPPDALPRVRDILLKLLTDSDIGPIVVTGDSEVADDPTTVSLNHVRPVALKGLIDFELCRSFKLPDYSDRFGPSRLDAVVRQALMAELTRSVEPFEPTYAVFGRNLIELTWLDEAWTLSQLDAIFPIGSSATDHSKFTAAFDAFAWAKRQHIYQKLFDGLRPKYKRAIENLPQDVSSKRNFTGEGLGAQLLLEFLHGDYNILDSTSEENLIVEFFRTSPEHTRSHAAWLLWDIWRQCPTELVERFGNESACFGNGVLARHPA